MKKFNPLGMAKQSKTFCILPWIHQYVGPPGDVKPCCVYKHKEQLGTMKDHTLEQIWNNEKTKEMRLRFLNGEQDPFCNICNAREELGHGIPYKEQFNVKFFENNKDIQKIVSTTNEDGSLDEHKLLYMDARFNNLCNLACRSCGPHFSTSWVLDHRKLWNKTVKEDINDGFQFAGKKEDQLYEEIEPHLGNLLEIYFAGGEPLMQKDHYQVLAKLIELGNTDLIVRYNTNFSQLKLGSHNAINYWKKFRNISIDASLDGSKEKAEYWRHGTKWDTIVKNRIKVMKEAPNVKFNIAFTLSWPNAFNLLEFHKEWVDMELIGPDDIKINCLDTPYYYSLKNIPDWKKIKIEKAFRDHIDWVRNTGMGDRFIYLLEVAIKYMWSETDRQQDINESLKQCYDMTKRLDIIRNESFFDVFPEHKDIENIMKNI